MSYKASYADGTYKDFVFTSDKSRLDLKYLYNLLCIPSKYSTGLPPERFPIVIEKSLCFSVFHEGKQIGFSRVISDNSEFASLWDVFIDDEFRRQGIGQALLNTSSRIQSCAVSSVGS